MTADEQKIISGQLVLLSRDVLVAFATKNLTSNKDLYMWLGLVQMSDPDSSAPYDFLISKIPDFEKKYQQELKKVLEKIKK